MSRIARLLKSARPETRRHFTNGCEMAGYYTAHMVDELNRFGFAPDQLGVLNLGDTPVTMPDHAVLLGVFTEIEHPFARLPDVDLSIVRVSMTGSPANQGAHLMISVYESSGFQLDVICPLKKTRLGVEAGETAIIDITGIPVELRAIAELDCLLDITQGMRLHAGLNRIPA